MDEYDKDLYFVAAKLLLRDGDKLLITHDVFGDWDIPGGRIKKDEFNAPLASVIERKIKEELSDDVKYSVGKPAVFFRVERQEALLDGKIVRIFAVGYEAKYLGGDIKLDEYHDSYEWVDMKSFKPEERFTGGWLVGIEEYFAQYRTPNA